MPRISKLVPSIRLYYGRKICVAYKNTHQLKIFCVYKVTKLLDDNIHITHILACIFSLSDAVVILWYKDKRNFSNSLTISNWYAMMMVYFSTHCLNQCWLFFHQLILYFYIYLRLYIYIILQAIHSSIISILSVEWMDICVSVYRNESLLHNWIDFFRFNHRSKIVD